VGGSAARGEDSWHEKPRHHRAHRKTKWQDAPFVGAAMRAVRIYAAADAGESWIIHSNDKLAGYPSVRRHTLRSCYQTTAMMRPHILQPHTAGRCIAARFVPMDGSASRYSVCFCRGKSCKVCEFIVNHHAGFGAHKESSARALTKVTRQNISHVFDRRQTLLVYVTAIVVILFAESQLIARCTLGC
jgi:hypothetical protein